MFPTITVVGGLCSLLIGFEKGQILKYNFNFNRIENKQINLSIYRPILPQVKTGNEPPFPLEKKKVMPVSS